MTNNNSFVPQIRFKGFVDDWTQRKFSEIARRVSEQSNASNLPKVEFEDIISDEGRLNKDISQKFDNRKGIAFEPNHILYGKLRPYLKNWLFADFKGIALGDFWVFEAIKSSPAFNYYLIQGEKYQEVANLSTGTKMPRSDWKLVSETEFLIPFDIAEQTAIGSFFRNLDDIIHATQRKVAGMKQLKAAYLQQMFPQAGECVPRVRFEGFSDVWETRRLEDVVEKLKSYSLSRDVETEDATGYRYIHYGDIHKQVADIITDDAQLPRIKEGDYIPLRKDDLVLADASEDYIGIAEPCVILHEPKEKIIAGLHTIAIRPINTNPLFLYYLFHTDGFRKFGGFVGTGLKVFGITFTNLSKYEMGLPSLAEQTAVGRFFHNIDIQIAVQSEKLEKLKRIKSAYLQKMFI